MLSKGANMRKYVQDGLYTDAVQEKVVSCAHQVFYRDAVVLYMLKLYQWISCRVYGSVLTDAHFYIHW